MRSSPAALAGHKTQRPDALAWIFDRHDPVVFDRPLGEKKIGDLLDRRVDLLTSGTRPTNADLNFRTAQPPIPLVNNVPRKNNKMITINDATMLSVT
ncbi:MAG: hypothetical protein CM1200mP2_25810 [Planctomycetaceae bacterium]|nr:MAG: hypothetical protein CM1200mP2_25810 [Planctomycetaceae bacterium]